MRRIRAAVLAVLAVVFLTASSGVETGAAQPCQGMWFESARTGRLTLVDFEQDLRCVWGTVDDKNALQRSGKCGMETQRNDLIVLTHNWYCGWFDCPVGSVYPNETNIPKLRAGEQTSLCDGGRLWRGTVVSAIHVGRDRAISPQTEFNCGGGKCGTIVTSVGKRYWDWGPADYVVVRMRFR